MCEYMIEEKGKLPKCKDGSLCLFCVAGNANKYYDIKNKESNKTKNEM